jgi:hypothetical protein
MFDDKLRPKTNDATSGNAFAKHSFPPDGLVAQSRVAYASTPLLTAQIRPAVFVFAGAGGNLTAIAGSPGGNDR